MDARANPVQFVLSVLVVCLYLLIRVSHAADAITAEQSLSGDQTIISAGGVFELGFFRPGKLSHYYIGIWYKKQNKVTSVEPEVVWVANRKHPVSDIFSSVLRISVDGNLVLFNESKSLVWSTNISSTNTLGSGTSKQAVLLDNGNLVLQSKSSSSQHLWQSFDHLTDTFLPGSKIGFNTLTKQTQMLTSWKDKENPSPGDYSLGLDPDGSNSYVMWHNGSTFWTSGFWNGRKKSFGSVPVMNNTFNYSYVTNENESYFTYTNNDPKTTSRLVLHYSGQIRQLILPETSNYWVLLWSRPLDTCDRYAFCGAFTRCNVNLSPPCSCLKGFVPKSPSDWYNLDWSNGCTRKTSLQCENAIRYNSMKDRFIEMLSKPSSADKQFQEVNSSEECESICSNKCECTAYAYANKTGCSLWSGDIVGNKNGTTLHIKTTSSYEKVKDHLDKRSLIITVVSVTVGLLSITFGYFLWKKRSRRERKYGGTMNNIKDSGENDAELPLFSFKSISIATNNFSEANRLGEGGFGPVFKGIFHDNHVVAVKRLSKNSGQGYKEFINELKLIAKLQHTNLVRLLGCCIEEEERILIYEFMPNRSLDKFLFDSSKNTMLDWGSRFRIIKSISHGILYIHKYSRLKIIHRDIKASNILLDHEMNPKISDFGMAKIIDINQTESNTNRVVGTYGYMSPEYALYGHFSEKLDVFSFGVLVLEIVSGKKNNAFRHFQHSPTLAGWAWNLWKESRELEVICASIRETCEPEEALRCIKVGFWCLQEDPADRPTMSSVIHMLQSNATTSLPLPKEPAFSTHCDSNTIVSNNAVTISIPEGR